MKALNQHPGVFCTENRFFGGFHDVAPNADGTTTLRITLDEYVRCLAQYYEFGSLGMRSATFRREMEIALVRASLEFSYSVSGKRAVVDKITPYRHTSDTVLDKVRRYFPGAVLIQLVRDGRDVLTSGVFDWIARIKKDHPRHALFVQKREDVVVERFFDDDDIEWWADEWVQPILAFRRSAPSALEIRYEQMKKDQMGVLRSVLEAIGADVAPEVLNRCIEGSSFERMSGGRKAGQGVATSKARKGVAGDWLNYFTRHDGEVFLARTGNVLKELGYEKDSSWIDALPERLSLTAGIDGNSRRVG